MNEKLAGKTYLKVTGVFYIIGGVFSIIIGALLPAMIDFLLEMSEEMGMAISELQELVQINITLAVAVTIALALLHLVAGIIGVKFCNSREKAQLCYMIGIILIVVTTIQQLFNILDQSFGVISAVISYVLPGLYFVGARKNKETEVVNQ